MQDRRRCVLQLVRVAPRETEAKCVYTISRDRNKRERSEQSLASPPLRYSFTSTRDGRLLRTQVRNTVTPARDRHLVATPSPRSPCSPRPPAPLSGPSFSCDSFATPPRPSDTRGSHAVVALIRTTLVPIRPNSDLDHRFLRSVAQSLSAPHSLSRVPLSFPWEVQCLPSLAHQFLLVEYILLISLARSAHSRPDTLLHRPLRSAPTRLADLFRFALLRTGSPSRALLSRLFARIFLITMPTTNAATADPNQPPVFNSDATADPVAAIEELRQLLTQLHSDTRNAFIEHNNHITTIQATVDAIPAPGPAPAPAAHSSRPPQGAKLEQFSGKVQDVQRFLQNLKDDIELQGATFVNNRQKVLYMASYLRETQAAQDWVAGTRISHPQLFNNFKAFTDAFESHFGSPNKVDEALRKLKELKQTGSAASGIFPLNMFFGGLKLEVQRWIYQLPDGKRGSLDDLVTRAIDSDNRLHELTRSNRPTASSSTSSKPSTSTPTSATSQTTSGPAPMDLGATRIVKPLDAAEKDRRKRLGLCGYCGGSHSLDDCQLLKEKNDRKGKASGKASPRA
ncbi:Retrotransposon gag protein [Rhizoctonia solani]|uniref:Retrotransposon gag protein n=1 Tax=Rhizoctonia solani TaxID=456999 RepID=A0A8H7M2X5_9AGAM|nr:Retrotransposon gag protein [Rhizoctonia solani]